MKTVVGNSVVDIVLSLEVEKSVAIEEISESVVVWIVSGYIEIVILGDVVSKELLKLVV